MTDHNFAWIALNFFPKEIAILICIQFSFSYYTVNKANIVM